MVETGFLHSGGAGKSELSIVLAHGAGAPMDSPFMNTIAAGLAAAGWHVVRFEFPYMAKRRADGKKRGPDSQTVLERTWREVVEALAPARLILGGKSLGGRVASMVAEARGAAGVLCLGYPFHPPGRPEQVRIAHFATLTAPTLILQGTRDPFGGPQDVDSYRLPANVRVHWLEDGDHGFAPPKRSGRTERQNLDEAVALSAAFAEECAR